MNILAYVSSLLRKLNNIPPSLAENFTNQEFVEFMRKETYFFSPAYAKRRVLIKGKENLNSIKEKGGILAFLHIGSFFLSGGALVHQLGIPYTAIASRRNIRFLPETESQFWGGVHQRSEQLYGEKLLYTDDNPHKLLAWLRNNRFLGVAIDVRELGQPHREAPFTFLENSIYLQTGPGRLAKVTGKPLIPMTIIYDRNKKMHTLYLGKPIVADNPILATQSILQQMEGHVIEAQNQLFHDLFGIFSQPHLTK